MLRPALLTVLAAVALVACAEIAKEPALSGDAARGRQVAAERGCTACHSSNGSTKTGPTFKGLYGSTVTLADGRTAVADDEYLRRAISDPAADVTKGFAPTMPAYQLPPAELDALLAYLRALAPAPGPTTTSG